MTNKLDDIEQMQYEIRQAVQDAVNNFAKSRDMRLRQVHLSSLELSLTGDGEYQLNWDIEAKIHRKLEPPKHPSFGCILATD